MAKVEREVIAARVRAYRRRQAEAGNRELTLHLPREAVDYLDTLKDRLRLPNRSAQGWRDIIDAADGLRYDLDVSKPLWGEACLAMGREQAAIALAIVSTKNPEYFKTTAGGYFHGMVAKAKRGELNLDRTIWALRGAAGAVRSPADFSEHRRYQ